MKKHTTLALSIIILLSCTNKKRYAIEHHIKAKEHFKKGDFKNAFSEIDSAITLDSTNLDLKITKAEFFKKINNYDLAINLLKEISSVNFKLDTVNYNLGSCYFIAGRELQDNKNQEKSNESYLLAISHYNKAIDINMQYFDAYISKSRVLHNLGKHDEALSVLNTAMNLFPDSILLIFGRGVEKIYLGDPNGAMSDLKKSIETNKLDSTNFASAYRFLGNIYKEKDNPDEAINQLTMALRYNPKDIDVLYVRAECYKMKGLKDKACEDYRKAADLGLVSVYNTIKVYCTE